MEDYTDLTAEEAGRKLKDNGLTAKILGDGDTVTGQLPAPGQALPAGSQVLLYLDMEAGARRVAVPDFTGMQRQQAFDAAGLLGLCILVTGNQEISPSVTVTGQDIGAGTEVDTGTTITLEFTDLGARD